MSSIFVYTGCQQLKTKKWLRFKQKTILQFYQKYYILFIQGFW